MGLTAFYGNAHSIGVKINTIFFLSSRTWKGHRREQSVSKFSSDVGAVVNPPTWRLPKRTRSRPHAKRYVSMGVEGAGSTHCTCLYEIVRGSLRCFMRTGDNHDSTARTNDWPSRWRRSGLDPQYTQHWRAPWRLAPIYVSASLFLTNLKCRMVCALTLSYFSKCPSIPLVI